MLLKGNPQKLIYNIKKVTISDLKVVYEISIK